MNLRKEILKEHTKAQCTKIVHWVGSNQERFDELFNHFISKEPLITQRAAWPLSYCVIAHPALISKHWAKLIKNLEKANLHDAVKRNSIRLIEHCTIPNKFQGVVMDICFKYAASPTESVAVKCFSLSVLHYLSKTYPEILPELKYIIEEQLPRASAGIKSRANKILRG